MDAHFRRAHRRVVRHDIELWYSGPGGRPAPVRANRASAQLATDERRAIFMASEPSESLLRSRSYIGLLLSQFLAAFNDQAIHFVAVFYAGDMLVRYLKSSYIDEKGIVTIVPL